MKRILILFMMVNVLTISQGVEVVKGKVMNRKSNMPLHAVEVKSSIQKVLTNSMGAFTIKVKDLHEELSFLKINFKESNYALKGKSIDIMVFMDGKIHENKQVLLVDMEMDVAECVVMEGSGISMCQMSSGMIAPQNQGSNEAYNHRTENGFRQVDINPLSTFSVDVDNAAYSNVRRYLNNGSFPPVNAVKIEEMVNYFNYDYEYLEGDHPFSMVQQMAKCPWNSQHYLLRIGLQAPHINMDELPPSNFVFLVDVSGSMQAHNKLPLLKSSLKMLVQQLRPNDVVSIVTYAGSAGVALQATSGENKRKILIAIDQLRAGGSTAGGAGLDLAYSLAEENKIPNGNNRIILATDGDFNVGPSDAEILKSKIIKYRDKGIYISVLGYGMGNYKDDKMEAIAQNGNGNHAYIDNLQEAKKVLVNEMGGNLYVVAKDVKIQIEFNPNAVYSYRLVGYENRLLKDEDFNNDKVDAGEVGAGHQVTALYEIVPDEMSNLFIPSVDPLKYQKKDASGKSFENELATIKVRYKNPKSEKSDKWETIIQNKLSTKADTDFGFASSVAMIGMLLNNSGYVKEGGFTTAIQLAKTNVGKDVDGYRAEFVRLAEIAKSLNELSEVCP